MSKRPHTQYDKTDDEIEALVNKQLPNQDTRLTVEQILTELIACGDSWEEMGVAKDKARTQILKLLVDVAPEKKQQTKYLGKQHSFEQGWNNATQYLAKIKELFQ